jgi:hypothetical protein
MFVVKVNSTSHKIHWVARRQTRRDGGALSNFSNTVGPLKKPMVVFGPPERPVIGHRRQFEIKTAQKADTFG